MSYSIIFIDGTQTPPNNDGGKNRFSGYVHYHLPIIPHSLETFREGLFGAITVMVLPFIFFWVINKIVPSLKQT